MAQHPAHLEDRYPLAQKMAGNRVTKTVKAVIGYLRLVNDAVPMAGSKVVRVQRFAVGVAKNPGRHVTLTVPHLPPLLFKSVTFQHSH